MTSISDRPRSERLPHHPLSMARIRRTVTLGMRSIWSHRLRSLLTVLGIVFGVCSVIAMLAIGEGASYEAREQLRQLGSNNIILSSVPPPKDETASAPQSELAEYGLTYADVDRIKKTIPGVEIKVPARIVRKDVWRRGRRSSTDIYGTVPWYPEVSNHDIARGRFFNRIELDHKSNVCVINEVMARTLFPMDSPMGRTVRVGSVYYQVIGVMKTKSEAGGGGISLGMGAEAPTDDSSSSSRMFIPLTTIKERFGEITIEGQSGSFKIEKVELHEVTVRVLREDEVVEVSNIIKAILQQLHKKQDYEVKVPLELLRRAERLSQIFTVVLSGIAAISLVVGGIGIMNIMLASVTERTREIGIRRAMGAKRRDIIIQFLVETVLLSATGGLIGVALGIAIPFAISHFANMKTIVTLWSPFLAFSISALVGIIFGIYPAMRAADMDPVEALRHE